MSGAVENASSSSIFTNLAASIDPPPNSVEAWMGAVATASSNGSAADHSQSEGGNPPATDKTKAATGGGSWLDRGLGILQAGVGVLEVVGGVGGGILTAETGVGAVAGAGVALHGLDDIQDGVREASTGKPTETFTQQMVQRAAEHAGVPPAAAAVIGMGVDIAAGGGVGGAEKAAVKGPEKTLNVARDLVEADKGTKAVKYEAAAMRAADRAPETSQVAGSEGGQRKQGPQAATSPQVLTFSRSPGTLRGASEVPPKNENAEMVRSINRQNESAKTLSEHGLDVEQLPKTGRPGPNPDLTINGQTADVYSPKTGNIKTIRGNIESKASAQAQHVVVDLDDSPLTSRQLIYSLNYRPIPGAKDIYVIKGGEVTKVSY